MRIPTLVLCALVSWGFSTTPASAAPCVSQPLAGYLALGAGGCTIGTVTFDDFVEATPVAPGAVAIDPATVTLTPLSSADGVGFAIDSATPIVAGPGELFQIWFGFGVSGGAGFTASTIVLGPPTVDGDGSISAVADVCRDGTFASPSLFCASGLHDTQIAAAIAGDAQIEDTDAFPGTAFLDVFVDVVVDGGPGGSASLGPHLASVLFATGATAVPAPGTAALLAAAGLALLVAARHRKPRARR